MRRRLAALTTAVGICLVPALATAHHSGAMNDMTRVVVLKGAIEKVEWVNPHVEVWLVATPANEPAAAPQTWVVGFTSPGVLTRLGWTRHTLNAGDKVTMEINPLRNGEHGGVFKSVTLANGQVVTGHALDYEKGIAEH